MGDYTDETRAWLDRRFRLTDADGVYFAHQPIYGFRAGPSEPGAINRYLITWQIMNALAGLRFASLLDVGGAEGYKAALARDLFGVRVKSVDLSTEACRRAGEIYGVDGEAVDIHKLPYADGEFDVVVCSETLEHVAGVDRAVSELLRVCDKAVVLTVPRESAARVAGNIRSGTPHAHIHAFAAHSFDYLASRGIIVRVRKYHDRIVKFVAHVADAEPVAETSGPPRWLIKLYNRLVPLLRVVCGAGLVPVIVRADAFLARWSPLHSGLLFVLVKDDRCLAPGRCKLVPVRRIVEFAVPLHRPSLADHPGSQTERR